MCLYFDVDATRRFSRNKKTDSRGYVKVYKKFKVKDHRLIPLYQDHTGYYYGPGVNVPNGILITRQDVKNNFERDGICKLYGGTLHCCLTEDEAQERGMGNGTIHETIVLPVYIKKADVVAVGKNRSFREDSTDVAVTKLLIKKRDYERAVK